MHRYNSTDSYKLRARLSQNIHRIRLLENQIHKATPFHKQQLLLLAQIQLDSAPLSRSRSSRVQDIIDFLGVKKTSREGRINISQMLDEKEFFGLSKDEIQCMFRGKAQISFQEIAQFIEDSQISDQEVIAEAGNRFEHEMRLSIQFIQKTLETLHMGRFSRGVILQALQISGKEPLRGTDLIKKLSS